VLCKHSIITVHSPTVQLAGLRLSSLLPIMYQTQASQCDSTVNMAISSVNTTTLY